MDEARANETRAAGRGVLWITAAKLYFVLTGVLLITLLPKLIGATDEERARHYGTFTVVIGVLNPITMMMISGTLQAVSKFISEDVRRFGDVRREALKLQTVFGGLAAGAFVFAAPLIAHLLGDDALTPYLRLAGAIVFCYALYAALIGCFNGRRMFFHQAAMDAIFATLKIGLILLLAALGFGVMGTVAGFAATAAIMLVVAWAFVGRPERVESSVGWKDILRFEVWIMLFALVSNLLMNADLYLVKALGPGDTEVGVYSVALQAARLPYIAVISVTFVIFPLVSAAAYAQDLDKARRYIAATIRYSLVIVAFLAVCLSAASREVLELIFPPIFLSGWPVLTLLPLAYMAYALLMIVAAIISGWGRPHVSVMLTLVALALSVVGNAAAVPRFGIVGAAGATTVAMAAGVGLAWLYLKRMANPAFPWKTLLRLALIAAAIYGLSFAWSPTGILPIIAKCLLIAAAFVAGLIVLGELTTADWERVRTVVRRRRDASDSAS